MTDIIRSRCRECWNESCCTEFKGKLHGTDGTCPQCKAKYSYETVDMEDELDPCPFCGSKAFMISGNYDGTFCEESSAWCSKCRLLVLTGGDEFLVEAWNSRNGLLKAVAYELLRPLYPNIRAISYTNIWDLDFFTGGKRLMESWYKNQIRQYQTAVPQEAQQ